MGLNVVSLFCGSGGMDLGFQMAGFNIIWGVDKDKYSCETHKKWSDAEIINNDINNIDIDNIPSSDVIVSSLFPQYSLNSKSKGIDNYDLNYITLNIILKKMPKAFICESSSKIKLLEEFLCSCDTAGYMIYCKKLNYEDYGIPQNKQKLVIVGIRKDIKCSYKFPVMENEKMTIGEALKCLENKNLSLNDRYSVPLKDIQLKKNNILDETKVLPPINLCRLHIKDNIAIKEGKLFTIAYQEIAIIQSFPVSFEFIGNKRSKFKQVVNAFAPKLAFKLANQLKKVLDNENSSNKEILFKKNYNVKASKNDCEIKGNIKCFEEVIKLDKIMLPDRYEGLEDSKKKYDITKIILPVKEGIDKILELHEEIESSNRGAFLILKGKSGCGKTTFLRTLDVFIEDIEINTIFNDANLVESMNSLQNTKKRLRIIIVEGRESLLESSSREINDSIHAINRFLRSKNGKNTLVVWPCNDKEIIDILVDTAENIGGTALLDLDETYFEFQGPGKEFYLTIAKQTIELLNNGRTLLDFGLTDEAASSLIDKVETIGQYLKEINKVIRKNKNFVEGLIKREPCKMWIVVLAGNEPDKDVAALTKGEFLSADVNRMLISTHANIVQDLKRYPDKIGILSNYFDCRIIYMPIVTTLSVIRDFAEDRLKEILRKNSLSDKKDGSGLERLLDSELAKMINSDYKAQAKKGKTGPNSISAFEKLTDIASNNDKILNKTFGKALLEAELIDEFLLEGNFGTGLTRRTDLVCKTLLGEIRLEFMWRKKTSQAEIANYTLTKLYNYGKAIGILD